MATYFMFGKYSSEGIKGISAKRTKEASKIVESLGGKVGAIYALLGERDLVFIVDLPGTKEAMKAAVSLSKLTGIAFCTNPAVPVADFDKILS